MQVNAKTKHDVLTEREMSDFRMNPRILWQIERFRQKLGLEIGEMNVLDWGCGRGRAVAWLRAHGYNAFGADVDPEPVNNCRDLLSARGLDAEAIISLIRDGKDTIFPDGFFRFAYTDGVLEHARDIEQVAANLKGLIAAGGVCVHFFPAHKHFVESHLRVPFVHWLPKNRLREVYLLLALLCGGGPQWKELKGKSRLEKAHVYYAYSVNKTYYRTNRVISEVFERNDFQVDFISLADFGLDGHPLLAKLVQLKALRPLLDWGMRNFGQVGLVTTRNDH
jgi:SAM-dependent methyltransferase